MVIGKHPLKPKLNDVLSYSLFVPFSDTGRSFLENSQAG